MLLGLIAGVLSDLASSLLIKAGIDDIVNVVPVHLIGGITGCVLLPFMIDSSYIQAGGRSGQFGVQLTGVAVNCLWAFGMAYLLFRVLDRIMGLRVTAEEEKRGLNIVEFSDIYSWQNYIEISAYESEINDKNRLLRKQARLLAVTEEQEKNKLAKDLHDGVGQSLSALKMILGMGKKQAEKSGYTGLAQTAEKASALADLSIKEMRNVLNNLKLEILQRDGLQAGLAEMTGNLDAIGELDCRLVIENPVPSLNEIRIFMVDDHKILRESLEFILSQEEDFIVCGQAENGMNLENQLQNNAPDVLLMDISMPKRNGFDAARALKKVYPDMKIIFLSMHKSEEMLAEAFRSGCSGYALKENAFDELATAIRKVSDGEIYVSDAMVPMMLNGFLSGEKENSELSDREREILKLLAEGFNNREIADVLAISVKTLETHRANIMKKHNFKNITELVLFAVRNHIVEA